MLAGMDNRDRIQNGQYGTTPIGLASYIAVYILQLGWLAAGAFLYWRATWPSSCLPHDLMQIYVCSEELAEKRSWAETGLAIWLWITPLMLLLIIFRWFNRPKR